MSNSYFNYIFPDLPRHLCRRPTRCSMPKEVKACVGIVSSCPPGHRRRLMPVVF